MFTGLIEAMGTVRRYETSGAAARLTLSASLPASEIRLGDSIAVNGVCLTVTAIAGDLFTFDVSPETLAHTSLRRTSPGTVVNLERALRLGDRLGGHIVTGHVDCMATVMERREESGNIVFSFRLPAEHARYLVAKGSVTVDGASLTVNSVSRDGFSINVIPHTARMTIMHQLRTGSEVNIECDILAKYVERLLGARNGEAPAGLSLELLAKSGFL
jgi:riboflavin synthase